MSQRNLDGVFDGPKTKDKFKIRRTTPPRPPRPQLLPSFNDSNLVEVVSTEHGFGVQTKQRIKDSARLFQYTGAVSREQDPDHAGEYSMTNTITGTVINPGDELKTIAHYINHNVSKCNTQFLPLVSFQITCSNAPTNLAVGPIQVAVASLFGYIEHPRTLTVAWNKRTSGWTVTCSNYYKARLNDEQFETIQNLIANGDAIPGQPYEFVITSFTDEVWCYTKGVVQKKSELFTDYGPGYDYVVHGFAWDNALVANTSWVFDTTWTRVVGQDVYTNDEKNAQFIRRTNGKFEIVPAGEGIHCSDGCCITYPRYAHSDDGMHMVLLNSPPEVWDFIHAA